MIEAGGGSTVLAADIGGTNARFAVAEDGVLGASVTLAVADFNSGEGLLCAALSMLEDIAPDRIRLAVAGPIEGGQAALTNGMLTFNAEELAKTLGGAPVSLYNDLQAAALALPHLQSGDTRAIGPELQPRGAPSPLALMSVGTGLGVSCFIPSEHGTALATEGGHASLPTATRQELHLLDALAQRHDHVSCERILSGRGLALLYEVMTGAAALGPDEIVAQALAGDSEAEPVLDQFCAFMGGVAGNLALTYGAWGGVFIGGGVPPRFADFLAQSPFRARFEAKGRFAALLHAVPTRLILRNDIALLGLGLVTV